MDISAYTIVLHPNEDDPDAVEPDSISVPSDYDNPSSSKSDNQSGSNFSYVTMDDYLHNMESSYNRSRLNQWINQINNLGYDQYPYSSSLNFDGSNFFWL